MQAGSLEADGKQTERYGWFLFTPEYLQKFASPKWALTFCCPCPFIQGVLINGLLHFFIPSLERQFELSSMQSGLISSGYDMAATICLLPMATFGGRPGAHRPRYIGIGLIFLGTGAIIFSIPAFLSGPYIQRGLQEVCLSEQTGQFPSMLPGSSKRKLGWILFLGNFLHGAGATPIYSLAVTFIDDCFPVHSSSFYISIYYTMAVLGPLVGIAVGGSLSLISVNFFSYSFTMNEGVEPDSPSWVGCWWLGFLMAGLLCYIFTVPILGLPREIPEMKQNRAIRDLLSTDRTPMTFQHFGELPRSLVRLFKNFKFLFLTLGACCEGIIFSGMAAFMTKLLLQQFGLGPQKQALVKATLGIPSSLIGMLGGGWVIKFFSMNLRQILIMIVCFMSISFPCIGGLFIHCPRGHLVGVTEPYVDGEIRLVSECNKNCDCDESFFYPVCGADNRTYFSGCYAGCSEKGLKRVINNFLDCECIRAKNGLEPNAVEGFCMTSSCADLTIFFVLMFIYQTLTFFCAIPIITSTLRVVQTDVRSLGVALQWVLGRLLGTIPGPLLFGKAIDDSCDYWKRNPDGSRGSCLLYDNVVLGRNLALVIFSSKLLEIAFFSIALRLAVTTHRRRRDTDRASIASTMW